MGAIIEAIVGKMMLEKMVAHQTCQYVPGNFTYDIKQDFPPPEVGNYQLYQIARLFPLGETAYAEGPVICVKA